LICICGDAVQVRKSTRNKIPVFVAAVGVIHELPLHIRANTQVLPLRYSKITCKLFFLMHRTGGTGAIFF
jgi:hypothetical protein